VNSKIPKSNDGSSRAVPERHPRRLHVFDLLGSDRESFAQRIFSRDIRHLSKGAPKLACILTAEARPRALFWMERQEERIRIYLAPEELESFHEAFQLYHFGEDISLETREIQSTEILIEGPAWSLCSLVADPQNPQEEKANIWHRGRILNLLAQRNLDFSKSENVFELGLEELCDSNKGCYVGQEVIERVRSRSGKPPRYLCLIKWGEAPQAGATLIKATEKVGQLTSSVCELSGEFYSLAFVFRQFCQPGELFIEENTSNIGTLVNFVGRPITSIQA
jgi:folate-binding protein YgfZ